jgi:glycosyltransferase involved in cell wall biosynthesis
VKKIRILHLASFPYSTGGIDTWLYGFLSRNKCYEIELYCPDFCKGSMQSFDISNLHHVKIIYLPRYDSYFSMGLWGISVAKILNSCVLNDNKNNTTFLALSTFPTLIPFWILKKIYRKKVRVVCSNRGVNHLDVFRIKGWLIGSLYKYIEHRLLKVADVILTNGEDTTKILFKDYGIKAITAPNCVDHDRLVIRNTLVKKEIKRLSEGRVLIGYVGTVRKIKGIEYLVEALALLSEEAKSRVCFVFVGKGNSDLLASSIESFGIKAIFYGEQKDVASFISALDYTIHLSGGSGLSHSLLESLALGVPVICWNNFTYTQVVDSSVGILVAPRDAHDLAISFEKAVLGGECFNINVVKNSVKKYDYSKVDKLFLHALE